MTMKQHVVDSLLDMLPLQLVNLLFNGCILNFEGELYCSFTLPRNAYVDIKQLFLNDLYIYSSYIMSVL